AYFLRWLDGRAIVPTIEALAAQHERTRAAEVDRALAMLERGQPPRRVIEVLARGLTSKLLHTPVAALHEANGAERAQLVAALSRIYGSSVGSSSPQAADGRSRAAQGVEGGETGGMAIDVAVSGTVPLLPSCNTKLNAKP